MKLYFSILLFLLALPLYTHASSEADNFSSEFSIDVTNDALVEVVKSIEKIIRSSVATNDAKTNLTIEWSDIDLYDRYYDVPELILLKSNAQLYQRTFVNQYVTSKKGKQKKTKDIIYFTNEKDSELAFKEKNYNKVKEIFGKHPLLKVIKRKERGILVERLNELTIKTPLRLKNILNLRSTGKAVIVKDNDNPILTLDILSHDVDSLESVVHYASVHFTSHTKESNLEVIKQISNNLGKYLLSLSQQSNLYSQNRYSHAYSILSNDVMFLNFKISHPALVNLIFSLGWFVLGFMLILVIFRKRMLS